jgi:hypothetical protein
MYSLRSTKCLFAFSAKQKANQEAKSMFTQRPCRSLGLVAHLGWTHFLVDRYRDLVEMPVPTREGPGGRHNFPPQRRGRARARELPQL